MAELQKIWRYNIRPRTIGRDCGPRSSERAGLTVKVTLDQVCRASSHSPRRRTRNYTALDPGFFRLLLAGKNAGATWAHDAPCHLEHAEPDRIQERRNDPLLVDALPGREIKRIYPVQGMIRGIPHHALKRVHHAVVGRTDAGPQTKSRLRSCGNAT